MTREIFFEDSHNFEVKKEELPEIDISMILFLRKLYKPNRIYRCVTEEWNEYFDPSKILSVVEKIQSIGDLHKSEGMERHKAEIDWLIELERRGFRLKGAWKLLETEHKMPKPLSKFISSVGSYLKQVTLLNSKERDSIELVERLLKINKNETPTFVSANFISFFNKYCEYIDQTRMILSKEMPTLKEYRTLANRVRTLSNFYDLSGEVKDNSDAMAMAQYLSSLSAALETVQDQIFVMEHTNDVAVEVDTTYINEKHQTALWEFIGIHSKY